MKQLIFHLKREIFWNFYHQKAANLKGSDKNTEDITGGNNNYAHIGIFYPQYEMTLERYVAIAANRVPRDGDVIRLVNKAFEYSFKKLRFSTTGGLQIEHNKHCGQILLNMRLLTNKEGDFFPALLKLMNLQLDSKRHLLNIYFLTIPPKLRKKNIRTVVSWLYFCWILKCI